MSRERKLLDMLYCGLYWLSEERGEVEPRRASTVMFTFTRVKGGNGRRLIGVSEKLATNSGLIGQFLQEAHALRVNQKPRKAQLQELAAKTDRPIILLVIPAGHLAYPAIFGAKGYYLYLTRAGQDRVHQLMMANSIEMEDIRRQFLTQWPKVLKGIGAMMAAQQRPGGRGDAPSGGQRTRGSIPRAPRSEDEWEW